MYSLRAEGWFDSAHFLTDYYGRCENLHGHRWRVVAWIEQPELQKEGTMKDMVLDFGIFKRTLKDLCDSMDHTFIVEEGSLDPETINHLKREGFELTMVPFRTTAENLARYFYDRLAEQDLPIAQVEVDETPNNCAIYNPHHTTTERA